MNGYPDSRQVHDGILAAGLGITCWRDDRFYCHDPRFDRNLRFLRQAPTPKQLKRLIEVEDGCPDCPDRTVMARVLSERYPAMCGMVKHVLVVGSYDGLLAFLDKYGIDEDGLPEHFLGEDCRSLDDHCLGVFWHHESTVLVNYAAIEKASDDADDPSRETVIGVWSTVLHELRHMAVDCPVACLRPADGPVDPTEDGVESWCREQTDDLIAAGII